MKNLIKSGTAIALVLGIAATVNAQDSNVSSEPPIQAGNDRTNIGVTPLGTPIVNIAETDDRGTSHNIFTKLNVGREGLIFNNSTEIDDSVLGGRLLANANLVDGGRSANLILAEVIGGTRSDLRGAVEVFGPKAALVIANAAGITCDGCGFFNVSRASLSTGQITFGSDGEFTGFAVTGGDVAIEGDGLLAGNVDFFDIVTASVNINARLFARDLVVSGGAADFDYAQRLANARDNNISYIAIDSSALGGMFANRIRLIGNGDGVGVNLQGVVNSLEGPLEIDAGGSITVRSAISAADISLNSSNGTISVDEQLYANGNVVLDAQFGIDQNSGLIGAQQDISLTSDGNITLGGSGLYAGLTNDGQLSGDGAIVVNSGGVLEASAVQVIATDTIDIDAATIALGEEAVLSGNGIALDADGNLILTGDVQSQDALSIVGENIEISGSAIADGSANLSANNIIISGDVIGLAGVDIDALSNLELETDGTVQTNGLVNIAAGTIDNQGLVMGVDGLQINTQDALANSGRLLSGADLALSSGGIADVSGTVSANGNAVIDISGTANIAGAIAANENLALTAGAINLDGTLSTSNNLSIESAKQFIASASSTIVADGDTVITADAIDAEGLISSGQSLAIVSDTDVTLLGRTNSGEALVITAEQITLEGSTASNNSVQLTALNNLYVDGILSASNNLDISASSIIDLTGSIEAGGILTAATRQFENNARLIGIGGISITGQNVELNTTSNAQSGAQFNIEAAESLTLEGNILSIGNVEFVAGNDFDQRANINLGADGQFVSGGTLNQNGLIEAVGALSIDAVNIVGNANLSSNSNITLKALNGVIDLSGDINAAGSIALTAPDNVFLSGNIVSNDQLNIISESISLSGNTSAVNGVSLDSRNLLVSSTTELTSGTDLALSFDSLTNTGIISSLGALSLETQQDLTNSGQIISTGYLDLNVGGDFSNVGIIQSGTDLNLAVDGTTNIGGTLTSASSLGINADSILINGTIVSDGVLSLVTANRQIIEETGVVFSQANINLDATKDITIAGQLVTQNDFDASSLGVFTVSGQVQSGNNLNVNAGDVIFNGSIVAFGDLNVGAQNISNANILSSSSNLSLVADDIILTNNSDIQSVGTLNISSTNRLSSAGSILSVGNASLLSGVDLVQNAAIIIGADAILESGSQLIQIGSVEATGALSFTGSTISGSGQILSNDTVTLSANVRNIEYNGDITAAGALGFNAVDEIILAGGINTNDIATFNGRSLSLEGVVTAVAGVNSNISSDLNIASSGGLRSGAGLNLVFEAIDNAGLITANDMLNIATTGDLNNIGQIISSTTQLLNVGGDFNSSGIIQAGESLSVGVAGNAILSGNLISTDALSLAAKNIDLESTIFTESTLNLSATNNINVKLDGITSSVGDQLLSAESLNIDGLASSEDDIELRAGQLAVLRGIVQSEGNLHILGRDINVVGNALSLSNLTLDAINDITIDGTVSSEGAIGIAANAIAISDQGQIFSQADLDVNVTIIDNLGQIGSANTVSITSANLNNEFVIISDTDIVLNVTNRIDHSGLIQASGALAINAANLSVLGDIIGLDSVAIDSANITAQNTSRIQSGGILDISGSEALFDGNILAIGKLDVTASRSTIVSGTVETAQSASFDSGESFSVTGDISVANDLRIAASSINNSGNLVSDADIEISAITGALEISGTVQAAGDVELSAINDLNISGSLQLNNQLSLNSENINVEGDVIGLEGISAVASGSFSTGDASQLLSNADIVIDSNNIDIGNVIQSGNDVSLSALSSITLSGDIIVTRDLVASADQIGNAGNVQTGRDTVLSATGLVNLSADSDIRSARQVNLVSQATIENLGSINSVGNLSITAADGLINTGQISSQSNLSLSANDLSLGGVVASNNLLDINANNLSTITGELSSLASLTLNSTDIVIRNSGRLISNGNLNLEANANITNAGALSSESNITLLAGGALINQGDIIAAANLSANITSDISIDGSFFAGDAVEIVGRDLTVNGAVVSQNDVLISTRNIVSNTLSDIQSGADLAITADQTLNLSGSLLAIQSITLASDNNLLLSSDIQSAGNLSINTLGSLNQSGSIAAADSINLVAKAAVLNGNNIADADINITLSGDLEANGLISAGGDLNIAAVSALLNSQVLSGGTLSASANNINIDGEISAVSDINFTASQLLTTTSSAAISSNQDISLNANIINNDSSLLANGRIEALAVDNLTNSGRIESINGVTLSANGILRSDAAISSIGTVSISGLENDLSGVIESAQAISVSGDDVTINGMLSAADDLEINGDNIEASMGSQLLSGTSIHINADVDADLQGLLAADSDITIEASINLALNGTTQTNENINISAQNIALVGDILAVGNAAIRADQDINIDGSLSAVDVIDLDAVNINLLSGSQILSDSDIVINSLSDFNANGEIGTASTINITANSLINNGVISAANNISLSSSDTTFLAGQIESGNQIDITGNDITLNGLLRSVGQINVAGSNFVSTTNAALLGSDVAIISSGAINSNGNIEAVRNISLSSTNGLVIDGSLQSSGNTSLNSGETLSINGTVEGIGTIDATADSINIVGDLSSNGGSNLISQSGDIVLDGRVASAGNINIISAADLLINGETISEDELSLNARDIIINALVFGQNELSADASRNINVNVSGSLATDGDLILSFGDTLFNEGTISSGSDFTINTTADYETSGRLFAGGIVSINARDITLNGLFVGEQGFNASGRNIDVTVNGDIQSGTTLSLNAAEQLTLNGNLLALEELELAGNSGITITGDTQSLGAIQLTTSANLNTSGAIVSSQSITLEAESANLNGSILSDGVITANIDNSLTVDALVSAAANISLVAGNAAINNEIISGEALSLEADNISVNASLTGTDSIDIRADRVLNITGASAITSGGTIDLAGGGAISLMGVIASDNQITISGGSIVSNANIQSLDDIIIASAGNLDINGQIAAIGDITIGGQATNLNAIIQTNSALLISATNLNVDTELSASSIAIDTNDIITSSSSNLLSGTTLIIDATGQADLNGEIASLGNLSLTADASLILRGSVQSDADLSVAGQSVDILGDIFSGEETNINSQTRLDIRAIISSVGNISANANIIDVAATGRVLGDSDIAFDSSSIINNAGQISGLGNVILDGEGSITNIGSIASASNITITSSDRINIDGALQSAGTLSLDGKATNISDVLIGETAVSISGTDIAFTNDAAVQSGGLLNITASGQLNTDGMIISTGRTSLAANGDFIQNAQLLIDDALILESQSLLSVTGEVQTSGALSLNGASVYVGAELLSNNTQTIISQSGDITVDAELSSVSNLALNSAANIIINEDVQSNAGIDLTASDVSVNARLAAIDSLIIDTSGNIAILVDAVVVTDGNASINSDNISNAGTISAGANLTLNTVTDISNDGDIVAGGTIDIDAIGAVDNNSSGNIFGTQAIQINANNILLNGTLFTDNRLTVDASQINVGGDVRSSGALSFNSDNNINLSATSLLISDTSVILDADNDIISNSQIFSGGNVSLNAVNSISTSNNIQASGAIVLDSAVSTLGGNISSDNNIIINGTNSILLTGVLNAQGNITLSDGDINLSSASQILSNNMVILTGNRIDSQAQINALNTISFNSSGDLNIAGVIASGQDVTLTASNSLTQAGILESASSLRLSSDNIELNGIVTGLDVIALNGGDINILSSGNLRSNGDITAVSNRGFGSAGQIRSSANIDVQAVGNITNSGLIVAGSDLSITATGDLSNSGAIEALGNESILSVSGHNVLSGDNVGSQIISNGSLSINNVGGTANLGGTISSVDDISLTSNGNVNISGTVVTEGDLSANITGALDTSAEAELLASNNLDISVSGIFNHDGTISNAGTQNIIVGSLTGGTTAIFESGNALNVTASSIDTASNFLSNQSINISSTSGILAVDGNISADGINLIAMGGNVEVGVDSLFLSTGATSLSSNQNLIFAGDILSNNDVSFTASGSINLAASQIETLGRVNAVASNSFDHDGIISADNNIEITAAIINANNLFSDGAITLEASGNISLSGDTEALGNISIDSTNSNLTLGNDASIRSQNNIVLNVGQQLTNRGTIVGGIGLEAVATNIENSADAVIAVRSGTLSLSAASLDLDGVIFSEDKLALNSASVAISGEVSSNDVTVSTDAALNVQSGGILQSGSDLTLNLSNLTANGDIRAFDDLVINANNITVGSSSVVESGAATSLSAVNMINNQGLIAAQEALSILGNVLNIGGELSSGTNTNINGGSLAVTGVIESGASLNIASTNVDLDNTAILRSIGGITINSTIFDNDGTIEANGVIALTATNALTNNNVIHSNSSLSFNTNALARLGGNITSLGEANIVAGSVIQSGNLTANNNINVSANSGNLIINGTLVSRDESVSLEANSALNTGSAGEIFGRAGISLIGQSIDNASDLLSFGAIALTGTNGIIQRGEVVSEDSVTLSTATNSSRAIILTGSIDASEVVLNTTNLNIAGDIRSAGGLDLNNIHTVTISGNVSINDDISYTGTTGSNFSITRSGSLVSGGSIAINNIDRLTVAGLLSATDDVDIDFITSANISGRIEAGDNVQLNYTGRNGLLTSNNVTIGGTIFGGNNVSINGGVIDIAGTVFGGNDVTIDSDDFVNTGGVANTLRIRNNATLASSDDLQISIIGGLNVDSRGNIQSDGDARFNALVHNINGSIFAGGTLSFTNNNGPARQSANQDFNLSGNVQSASTLNISSDEVNLSSSSVLLSNNNVIISGSEINAQGTIAAGAFVSLRATDDITIGGLLQSGRRISVTAGDNITISSSARIETLGRAQNIGSIRNQSANANISINARDHINNAGTLFSSGSIAFNSSNNNITNRGAITGLGTVVLQADNGSVSNLGNISANSLAIFQDTNFINRGSFVANGNLLISAPNISNSGLIGAGGSLELDSEADIINSGTIFAFNNISLNAGLEFHNDQGLVLAAAGNIAITANNVLNESSRIEALAGNITIDTNNLTNRIQTLVISSGGTFRGPGLYTNSATPAFVGAFDTQDCGLAEISCSGGTVTVLQTVFSPITGIGYRAGSFQFITANFSNNDQTIITNTGASAIVAAGDININANRTVTNSNSSILAGDDITIDANTLNNIADTVRTTTTTGANNPINYCLVGDGNNGGCVEPEFFTLADGLARGFNLNRRCSRTVISRCVISGNTNLTSATVDVPLPTIIRAGGAVSITANQLGNGSVSSNGAFVGGTDTNPNTNTVSVSALGGRRNFADPSGPNEMQIGRVDRVDDTDARAGANAINNNLSNDFNSENLSSNESTGAGAGTITGANTNVVMGGGNASNASSSTTSTVGSRTNAAVADSESARLGFGLFDADNGLTTVDLGLNVMAVSNGAIEANVNTPDNVNVGSAPIADSADVDVDTMIAAVNLAGNVGMISTVSGATVAGRSADNVNVSAQPSVSVEAVMPDIATNANVTTGLISGQVEGADSVDMVSLTSVQDVRVSNDQVSELSNPDLSDNNRDLSGLTATNGPTSVEQSNIGNASITISAATATERVISDEDSLANTNPVDGVQQTDLTSMTSVPVTDNFDGQGLAQTEDTALLDGFNGIAINNILGSDGLAGQFIFDFLGQFGLISSDSGFGFADGSSLFTFDDSPDAEFLFSIDRGFGSDSELFDSDYFFDQLNVDRATNFTRLGDGFFEAQLISQQVQEATNQALLPQFGNVFDQASGLYQAAIDQKEALGLELGIALTVEQIESLSSSVVWLVNTELNGRSVLVPVLYLTAADQKSIENGAIIAGNNVLANIAGNINNDGFIEAENIAELNAGGNIINTGLIGAQYLVDLTADKDILNRSGGQINGGDIVANAARDIINGAGSRFNGNNISLTAGRDVTLDSELIATSTSTGTRGRKGRFSSSNATSETINGGEIVAQGDLTVNAGRDISVNSSSITAAGNAALTAGRDIEITGAIETSTTDEAWKRGKKSYGTSSSSSENFVGSSITAGGNLVAVADNKINIIGSNLQAGGSAILDAENGINISSAVENSSAELDARINKRNSVKSDESSLTNIVSNVVAGEGVNLTSRGDIDLIGVNVAAAGTVNIVGDDVTITGVVDRATFNEVTVKKKKGLLSSKKTTTTTNIIDEEVVASTIEGNAVNISGLGDIDINASNVVAVQDVNIAGNGDITIGVIETTDVSDQTIKVKKSGLSFSGGSLFAGVSKNKTDSENTTISNIGSLIGSLEGSVSVRAGEALTVSGSEIVSPGAINLIGDSVSIQNVTDVETSKITTESSSFGVTVSVNSPIISGTQSLIKSADALTGTGNGRTKALAGLAGGLAAVNTFDAVGKVGKLSNLIKSPLQAVSVSVSVGFSKSKSETNSIDETIIGSNIVGNDISIIATGEQGTIDVIASRIEASNNLLLAAEGDIILRSDQEDDSSNSTNSSSGFSAGITFGAGGFTPNASVNFGKGNSSSNEVTNIESILSAGNIATISTPNALTLQGAIIEADSVAIDVGALTIRSEQDTADFRSRQRSIGLSASLNLGKDAVKANPATNTKGKEATSTSGTAGFNFGSSKEDGRFASVAEQSGIIAGEGGFDIKVRGATELEAAIVASSAAAARNRLETGTLTSKDLVNVEEFSASSTNLSASISGIGAKKGADIPPVGSDENGQVDATNSGKGVKLPGLATALGTITAAAPQALGASGDQKGTSSSAIADGAIIITSGDAASQEVADSISRDTANGGALTQEFDEARRAEIQEGFTVTKELIAQTSIFFANRAAEADRKEEESKKKEEEAQLLTTIATNLDIDLTKEERDNLLKRAIDLSTEAKTLEESSNAINKRFGPASTSRQIITAITAAASGNAAGGSASLVKDFAANILQQRGAELVGDLSKKGDINDTQAIALHALVGCAGGGASTSGNCTAGAAGQGGAKVLGILLGLGDDKDASEDEKLSAEEREAQSKLLQAIVGIIGTSIGAEGSDLASAIAGAQAEVDNNQVAVLGEPPITLGSPVSAEVAERLWNEYFESENGSKVLAAFDGDRDLVITCIGDDKKPGCAAAQARLALNGLTNAGFSIQSLVNVGNFINSVREGIGSGATDQAFDNLKGLLVGIGNSAQFVGDNVDVGTIIKPGDAGDLIRTHFGVNSFIDEILPSAQRGRESKETLRKITEAFANYAGQAIDDPNIIKNDIANYLEANWETLQDNHLAAVSEGPDALGKFYGEILGRVILEAALIIVPVSKLSNLAKAENLVPNPRVHNGVELDPRLPDPDSGLDYQVQRLENGTENNRNSHINGYVEELKLANNVAKIPGETVLSYGGRVGTNGADIISVHSSGRVTLWDNKFLTSRRALTNDSSTFTPGSNRFQNAIREARDIIDDSNLPAAAKAKALANINAGNFSINTPGSGGLTNSRIGRICNFKLCGT